ncbi:MAG: hypothetical protein ABTQ27_17045 [Amaricoccus sp.]|uniref:hypothetical protein n=1 Tax=Amaricoccus sp. TaxID=1872485 RepID=UPI003314C6ED
MPPRWANLMLGVIVLLSVCELPAKAQESVVAQLVAEVEGYRSQIAALKAELDELKADLAGLEPTDRRVTVVGGSGDFHYCNTGEAVVGASFSEQKGIIWLRCGRLVDHK